MASIDETQRKHAPHLHLDKDEKKRLRLFYLKCMIPDPDAPDADDDHPHGFWKFIDGWNATSVADHLGGRYTENNCRTLRNKEFPAYYPPEPAPLPEPEPEPEPAPPQAPLDMLAACRDFIKAEVSRQIIDSLKNRTTIKTHNGLVDKHNELCDDVAALQKKCAKLTADMQSLMAWATERGAPNADLGFPSE